MAHLPHPSNAIENVEADFKHPLSKELREIEKLQHDVKTGKLDPAKDDVEHNKHARELNRMGGHPPEEVCCQALLRTNAWCHGSFFQVREPKLGLLNPLPGADRKKKADKKMWKH